MVILAIEHLGVHECKIYENKYLHINFIRQILNNTVTYAFIIEYRYPVIDFSTESFQHMDISISTWRSMFKTL